MIKLDVLHIIGIFLSVLLVIIFGLDVFWLKNTHPTIYGYAFNIATECIGLIITLCIIQRFLDKYDENKEEQEELKKILRYHESISIYIDYYLRYFYCVTTPLNKRFKEKGVSLNFKIQDLSDLYETSALITSDIFQPSVEIFYKYEQNLRNIFTDTIKNIDFKYYPQIGRLLLDYIQASLANDVSDAIIGRKNIKNGLLDAKTMLKADYIEQHYKKYKENTLGANSATPYFILYDLLQLELKIINGYINEIDKIKKGNK